MLNIRCAQLPKLTHILRLQKQAHYQCVCRTLSTTKPVYTLKPDSPLSPDYGLFDHSSSISFSQWIAETSMVQGFEKYLTLFHDYSGLTWAGSIVICTILLRAVVMTPLTIHSFRSLAKYQKFLPELEKIKQFVQVGIAKEAKEKEWDNNKANMFYKYNLKVNQRAARKAHKVPPLPLALALPMVQLPVWVSMSFALRHMTASLPYMDVLSNYQIDLFQSLSGGGALWFQNLCIADPYFILPVCMCIFNLSIIEIYKGQQPPGLKRGKIFINFVRGLSIVLLPIACQMPSGIVLYWATSSFYGFVQALLLLSPTVRTKLELPVYTKTPYVDLLKRLKIK